MAYPPEAFMIFKEELAKAKLEKERLKAEYEEKTKSLSQDLDVLKERIAAQEDMLKTAWSYAIELENKLSAFQKQVDTDNERNGSGYH